MPRRWSSLLAVAAVLVTSGACGDDADDDAGAVGASDVSLVEGVEVDVSAIDNTFRPDEVEVAAGTEVRWTNDGRNTHNVLPVDGEAWGVEVTDFEPGDEYRHRFTEPGTYPYYCSLHGTTDAGMTGTIVVTG